MKNHKESIKEITKAIIFTLCSFLFIYIFSGFAYGDSKAAYALEQDTRLENNKYDQILKNTETTKNELILASNKLINDKYLLGEKIIIKDGKVTNSQFDIAQNKKIAYLTFDDGPSQGTIKILDILNRENIKATFFIVGEMAKYNPNIVIREKNEGHTIANHTYSHNYNYLYASTNNLLSDLKKNDDLLKSILGEYDNNIIRFPGGSDGKKSMFKKIVEDNNYRYVDWNCLTGDADAPLLPKDALIANFKKSFFGQKSLVVLMHDMPGKSTTIDALPSIIQILRNNGYEFKSLK